MLENNFDVGANSHPRDANVSFVDEGHLYTIKDYNEKTISVTTLIKKYFPEFDDNEAAVKKIKNMTIKDKYYPIAKEIILQYYSELNNEVESVVIQMGNLFITEHRDKDQEIIKKINSLSKEDECYQKIANYIKDDWKRNGKEASENGTDMHADIEKNFLKQKLKNPDSKEFKLFLNFWEQIKIAYSTFVPYRPEWIVYDEDIGLCGSIDLVLSDNDGNVIIIDWKRSKEIKFENKWQKATAPFQNYDDCNYLKYSLQLNFYRHMLENKYGKRVVGMLIVVLHPSQDEPLIYPVERIDLSKVWNNLI